MRTQPSRRPTQDTMRITSLPTKQPNAAQTEVGKLEMPVLVDQQVVRFQVT
jgi:hypothetical protein